MRKMPDGNGTDCCLAHETLDQNKHLRPRVFYPTLADPEAEKKENKNG